MCQLYIVGSIAMFNLHVIFLPFVKNLDVQDAKIKTSETIHIKKNTQIANW